MTQLLTDEERIPEPTNTSRTVSYGAVEEVSPGAPARAVAQDKNDQAKLREITLQDAAEKTFRIASVTKAKYFEALERVLKSTIVNETLLAVKFPAAYLASNELPDLEYDYQIAIVAELHSSLSQRKT